MKYLQAIGLLATAAQAAKYPAGAICQTNIECNAKCLDGQWSVGQMNSDYVLVCDPTKADTTIYFAARCYRLVEESGSPFFRSLRQEVDAKTTEAICKAQGGTMCDSGCVVSGKASAEGDLRNAWRNGCTAQPSTQDEVLGRPTLADAKREAACSA